MFFDEPVPVLLKVLDRAQARAEWLERAINAVRDCDLVFLDPDNGLARDDLSPAWKRAGKSVRLEELRRLIRPDRTLVAYHHQTRMAGGHLHELDVWAERLGERLACTVDALRFRPYSPRAFFLINADEELRGRAAQMAEHWGESGLTWHPDLFQAPH
ncbi:MAG: hypothetical protein WDM92_13525 [Caulobacteraceae bacterium]